MPNNQISFVFHQNFDDSHVSLTMVVIPKPKPSSFSRRKWFKSAALWAEEDATILWRLWNVEERFGHFGKSGFVYLFVSEIFFLAMFRSFWGRICFRSLFCWNEELFRKPMMCHFGHSVDRGWSGRNRSLRWSLLKNVQQEEMSFSAFGAFRAFFGIWGRRTRVASDNVAIRVTSDKVAIRVASYNHVLWGNSHLTEKWLCETQMYVTTWPTCYLRWTLWRDPPRHKDRLIGCTTGSHLIFMHSTDSASCQPRKWQLPWSGCDASAIKMSVFRLQRSYRHTIIEQNIIMTRRLTE